MPKTYVAKSIQHFNPLAFVLQDGQVVGFTCSVEVNYGDRGITESLDLWPLLGDAQKQAIQQFHATLKQKLEAYYL